MKWLKAIITVFGTAFLGMAGGQSKIGGKGTRRFGISGLALAMDGLGKRSWPLILLVPVLIMGYGDKSILMGWIGSEFLVRVAYGALLSLPFLFYGLKRWMVACIALVIAFQIIAGSVGYVSWFGDILIEDIVRYGVLGILIAFNLFFYRE